MQDSTAKLQAGMSITPTASADAINESTQQRVLLNRIVFDIRNTLIVDEILQKTVDSLHQALNLSGCAIFQPNSSNLFKVSHVSNATVHGEKLIGTTSQIYSDYYQALSQGETLVIQNIEPSLTAEIQSADIADEISSLILVPLVYEQKLWGGISLFQFDLKRKWTTEELYFVEAIAQHCAVAIYQAQLYQKAQTEIAQRQQSETLLLQTTSELQSLFQAFPDLYFRLAKDGTILSYHPGSSVELYLAQENLVNQRLQDILPGDVKYQCYKAFLQVLKTNSLVAVEYSLPLPDGEKNFEARLLPSQDQQVIVIVRDITHRKQIELALQTTKEQLEIKVTERTVQLTNANVQLQTEIWERQWTANLLSGQNRIMEMIAKGASLRSCLNVIAQFIEKQSGEVACAIALVAENGINLKYYVAPSLPKKYVQNVSALGISPNFASCNTPYCYQKSVIVSDIATDPKWQTYSHLALTQGLRACFATPILATSGNVLGILELYYSTPRPPNLSDRKLVDIFTQIAGIAIERQRVEESRQRSKQRFQNLVETTSDWVWEVNEKAIYTYVSPKIRDLLGYEPEEVLGKTPFDLMPLAEAEGFANSFWAIVTAQQPISGLENTNLHKDGHLVILETSGVPIFDADGNFRGYRGIDRDITKRKQAEQEMVRALEKEKELSELKSSFVSMTSHEFRTPMSTILSSAELLEHYHHKFTEEKRRSHLHRIQSAIQQMTQLLNDVLTIGKAEAGKLEFKPEFINLEKFCKNLTEEMQLSIGNSHEIIFSKQGEIRHSYMDEKLLRHIFSNLLSNAVKYSPHGGTIYWKLTIESVGAATPVEYRAIFQVQDQGIGIPETDQKRLFDSFFRATNVGMIPGTGLGLAIIKNCVDLHGGEISLSSQVGVGTTFTVILPLHYEVA